MSVWYTSPDNIPLDGQTVWVRLNYWFGQPFLAVWNLATEEFVSVDNSVHYPAWSISRWNPSNVIEYFDIGYKILGGSIFGDQQLRAMPVTVPKSCSIVSMSIFHLAGSENFLLGVYSNGVDNLPDQLLASIPLTQVSGVTEWQTVNLVSELPLNAGDKVWLAFVFENNPGLFYSAGTPGRAASTFGWVSPLPSDFGDSSVTSFIFNIYATCKVTIS